MKIILLAFMFTLVFCAMCHGQSEPTVIAELKKVNNELIAKYDAGKYDDALKPAKRALELTIAVFGENNNETARSYKNLGEVYRMKRKFRESADNLYKAYAIYQRDIIRNGESLTKVLNSLGIVLALDDRQIEAEQIFMQSVAYAEKVFGKETKETLPALKALTNFYVYTKQYDKADDIFLKRYLIHRIFRKNNDTTEFSDISDEHFCYMLQNFNHDEQIKRDKVFFEREKAQRTMRFGEEQPTKTESTIVGGVVNGKAISLRRPSYPSAARSLGLSGKVSIKVLIDEEGNVISAKGFCGNPVFYAECEGAARKSKFSPTTLSGSPVKVSGIITYNFIR